VGSLTTAPVRQSTHERIVVADTAAPGAVRRVVLGHAHRLGLAEPVAAAAGQAATELATNLLRHAEPGGWMLVRPLPAGVEMLAVDRGPGIADLSAALAGRAPGPHGLGCGLAAVRDAATHFDVYTEPEHGTVVLAVVQAEPDRPGPVPGRRWAGVSVGIDEPCGDGWVVSHVDGETVVAVVDGLGHGQRASEATDVAVCALAQPPDLTGYLSHANEVMRETRGAAIAVCRLEHPNGELSCLSVGNISGRIHHQGHEQSLVPYNGTLGLYPTPPAAKVLRYPWPPQATLVLWSDGLTSRLTLTGRGDLLRHDPAVIAAVLHRDHGRERDDATVVVVRGDP
jgi:anti-sigma regulatory factor (Ser/Thr protein kinase)